MRVVFMGTPDFAVPSLRALASEHEVLAVFTRPDAVRGRGSDLVPSAVKAEALALGIPVHEPRSLRGEEPPEALRTLAPDITVVAAYGLILPPAVLDVAPRGVLNVHASLLPRWRGAAPVARAILAGDAVTGVSIMRMEEGLDTGPYATVVEVPVGDRSVGELTALLAEAGAEALLEAVREVEAGSVRWTLQDEARVTYAAKITSAELVLEPSLAVLDAWRRVRASTDSAPCVVVVAGVRLRVLEAQPSTTGPTPGAVAIERDGLILGLSDGGLRLERLVPEGKRPMDAAAWARGARLPSGARWDAT